MKTIAYCSLFFLLFFGCKHSQNLRQPKQLPTVWQIQKSADQSEPIARHEAAFVRVGSKCYLMGGRGIRPVSIYDIESRTWSQGKKPPIELHHFQPVVYENDIYVIGALTGGWPNETPTTKIYRYHPDEDLWSEGHEVPEDRRRGASGVVLHDGYVYVLGGIKNGHIGDHKNWLDRYDPATGAWKSLSDAPRTRDHFQAVYANGHIYAAAGRNTGKDPDDPFGATIPEVDAYDIATDTWSTLPNPLPTQRAGNAATYFNGEVLVIGGESSSQEKAHAHVEALDPKTGKWRSAAPLVAGRHGTGVVVWKNSLYIASGCGNRGGEPELATMERFE